MNQMTSGIIWESTKKLQLLSLVSPFVVKYDTAMKRWLRQILATGGCNCLPVPTCHYNSQKLMQAGTNHPASFQLQ